MDNAKYIVFKRAEFDQWLINHPSDLLGKDGNYAVVPVPDAVVIRRQDVFAPPALDAYANSISIALEISEAPNTHLQVIADYFHEQACEAWQTDRKIPD